MKEHSKNQRPSNWDKHSGQQKQENEKKRSPEKDWIPKGGKKK